MPRISLDPSHFPPPGRMIDIGGCRLHVRISGSGSPAVVLEAGIAATSLSWALVEPELAKFTTVISYDRAGLGWSGPSTSPRTPGAIAAELRRGLELAGISGQLILVGHSFGGLVVRRFARDYREVTAGVVLVDPLDPAEWCPLTSERRRMLMRGVALSRRGALLARMGVVRSSLSFLLSGNRLVPRLAARLSSGSGGSGFTDRIAGEIRKLPRELWPSIAFHWSQAKSFEGMARHLESLPESAADLALCEGEVSPVPVTLLLAERAPRPATPAHWSLRIAERAGHWIQLDRPDLVIGAVREMIDRVRGAAVSDNHAG